jgi:hypothetical protein
VNIHILDSRNIDCIQFYRWTLEQVQDIALALADGALLGKTVDEAIQYLGEYYRQLVELIIKHKNSPVSVASGTLIWKKWVKEHRAAINPN